MSTQTVTIARDVPLRHYTTLRAGGAAEYFAKARTVDEFAALAVACQTEGQSMTILGWGSNILPSDQGVPGLVVHNAATGIEIGDDGEVVADTGCGFQDLVVACAQHRLRGMEFAIGIPGTLGGALVSNAGAYRGNVSEYLTDLEVVFEGKRQWVKPDFMEFSYRDSILRRSSPPACAVLRVRFRLPSGDPKTIYDRARDYQRQRISKQPPPASAGSFFKNVNSAPLAAALPKLPQPLKEAGVVPAGFLIEGAGLAGYRLDGAMISRRHANFLLNVGGASATAIRRLAEIAKSEVWKRFRVRLEEEVLYLGDWRAYEPLECS